jgi:hypothetical protein
MNILPPTSVAASDTTRLDALSRIRSIADGHAMAAQALSI